MTPTPDPATVPDPVLTVARWEPDEVELTVGRSGDTTIVARPGEEPVAFPGGVLDAVRASGALTLRDDDHLIVDFDDRAGISTDDGYEFLAVTDDDRPGRVLVEVACWESGSMCGGWSTWVLSRLPSGTLVRIEQINEVGGTFCAFFDATTSDLDAVEQYLDALASDFCLPTHATVWAQARLGIVVDRHTDVDPDGSETLVLEQFVDLPEVEFDELVARIERRFPTMVVALREHVTRSATHPA